MGAVALRACRPERDTAQAMSQENVESLRRSVDAFNRGDRAAWLATADPGGEMVPAKDWPENRPVHGPKAIWDYYVGVTQAWEVGSFELPEIIEAGADKVVFNARRHARGRDRRQEPPDRSERVRGVFAAAGWRCFIVGTRLAVRAAVLDRAASRWAAPLAATALAVALATPAHAQPPGGLSAPALPPR